jgi:hypothetical protein
MVAAAGMEEAAAAGVLDAGAVVVIEEDVGRRLSHRLLTCSPMFFLIFFIFSEFPKPSSKSRSNLRCHRCVPGGLGTQVWC